MNICDKLKKLIMSIRLKKSCVSTCCNTKTIIIEEECHHEINLTKIDEMIQTDENKNKE